MLEITSPFVPRLNFGRRLEPAGDVVLHGAGQSPDAFKDYWDAVGVNKPSVYMTYISLKDDLPKYFATLQAELELYAPARLMPQIGLFMNGGGLGEHPGPHYEHEVAEGKYDAQIEALCRGLKYLNRPVYLRIGFEFNGSWNGYVAEPFKAAWRRIVMALRAHNLNQVATLWCYCPLASAREKTWGVDRDYAPFYPGDDWVDWWSIDLFEPAQFAIENALFFMKDAEQHGFPVMIGETTPRWVGGVQRGAATWGTWYETFFNFIRAQPAVKGFCYINWDWAKYPGMDDWGDARIGENPVIVENYQQEMTNAFYRHA
jgi:hypothetical protein